MPGTNFPTPLSSTCTGLLADASGLFILASCAGVPPTTANVFQVGCKIIQTDIAAGVDANYVNTGTAAAPVWSNSSMSQVVVTQTAAQIVATTAGSLSHANGLIVVPAAPAGFVNVFHKGIVSYTFGTAAFTGGGNTTFNIGGGGAALTGLIATTTLWQNASSIIQQFNPLSTVAFPITTASSINLVTASAITQPGTAAGTAKVYAWFSQVPI